MLGGKKEPARQFHLGVGVPAQLLKCPAEKEYTAQLSPPLAIERVLARRSGNNHNNKIWTPLATLLAISCFCLRSRFFPFPFSSN